MFLKPACVLALSSLGFLLTTRSPAAPPLHRGASELTLDPVHSFVLFKVMNRGVSHVYGRFDKMTGRFELDEDDPARSRILVEVDAASLDTGNAKRDDHLRSPDFFSVEEHPTIVFESTSMKRVDTDVFDVEGDLTLLGRTKPVSFRFTRTGTAEITPGTVHVGAETSFTVRRSDFGMDFLIPGVADEVTLIVDLEAVRE